VVLHIKIHRYVFIVIQGIENKVSLRHNALISQDIIRRRLAEHQLLPYVPATGLLLTAEHRRNRLEFVHAHLNLQEADSARVLFTRRA
jgi:hypothetical protein